MNALNFWKGLEFSLGKADMCRSLLFPRLEGDMRLLGAALVCIAVLYGVDAFFFGGRYGQGVDCTISDIYRHW
jgi:hypothetical protein